MVRDPLRVLRAFAKPTRSGPVGALAATAGGEFLVGGADHGFVGLFDVESGLLVPSLHGLTGTVEDVAVSPDGGRVATVGEDGALALFDTSLEELERAARRFRGRAAPEARDRSAPRPREIERARFATLLLRRSDVRAIDRRGETDGVVGKGTVKAGRWILTLTVALGDGAASSPERTGRSCC